jgi:hypothetical protein
VEVNVSCLPGTCTFGSQNFHNTLVVLHCLEKGGSVGILLVRVLWAGVFVVGLWILLCNDRYNQGVRKLAGPGEFLLVTRGSPWFPVGLLTIVNCGSAFTVETSATDSVVGGVGRSVTVLGGGGT